MGVLTVKTWGVLTSKTWGVLTVNVWGVLTVNMWVYLPVYKGLTYSRNLLTANSGIGRMGVFKVKT
eukprot:425486-Amorphochlora_amoeboformis.AAC.1